VNTTQDGEESHDGRVAREAGKVVSMKKTSDSEVDVVCGVGPGV